MDANVEKPQQIYLDSETLKKVKEFMESDNRKTLANAVKALVELGLEYKSLQDNIVSKELTDKFKKPEELK